VNRLIVLIASAVVLTGLILLGLVDTASSTADTDIPHNQVASSPNETHNSYSANAIITITMRTPPLPDE
jgi:hypothetical protein